MAEAKQHSWLVARAEQALRAGFTRAYETVRVDPSKFLLQLQAAYGLPISTFRGVYSVDPGLLDGVAHKTITILAAITMRTVQKLSLLYGFEYNTDDEIAELWIAAASAAGVDISRELLEKEVVNRFVPKVIQRIATRASTEVVEKWAGRVVPIASSVIGAGLNYYFVRSWGERAQSHFRQKHVALRRQIAAAELVIEPEPRLES